MVPSYSTGAMVTFLFCFVGKGSYSVPRAGYENQVTLNLRLSSRDCLSRARITAESHQIKLEASGPPPTFPDSAFLSPSWIT